MRVPRIHYYCGELAHSRSLRATTPMWISNEAVRSCTLWYMCNTEERQVVVWSLSEPRRSHLLMTLRTEQWARRSFPSPLLHCQGPGPPLYQDLEHCVILPTGVDAESHSRASQIIYYWSSRYEVGGTRRAERESQSQDVFSAKWEGREGKQQPGNRLKASNLFSPDI